MYILYYIYIYYISYIPTGASVCPDPASALSKLETDFLCIWASLADSTADLDPFWDQFPQRGSQQGSPPSRRAHQVFTRAQTKGKRNGNQETQGNDKGNIWEKQVILRETQGIKETQGKHTSKGNTKVT